MPQASVSPVVNRPTGYNRKRHGGDLLGKFQLNVSSANGFFSATRILLALAALGNQFLNGSPSRVGVGAAIAFLAYSVVAAVRKAPLNGAFGLLALFIDTLGFLVLNYGVNQNVWFAAVFYLFLLGESVAFHRAREVAVVAGGCLLFSLLAPFPGWRQLLPCQAISGVLAYAFAHTKARLRDEVRSLAQSSQHERERAAHATDAERQRIASDFHDGPLQSYISFQMRLEILRKILERDREAGMAELEQMQGLALAQVHELRSFIRNLRGQIELDSANLFVSAHRIAEDFQKASGIPVTFIGTETPVNIPQETCAAVLQMLREALNNVHKHAGATRVAVAMERNGQFLEISVDDNGNGFPFSGTYN